ncbi:EmrB/QacA subfamily drug resistance transporter [Haloactinopolyspora alba]|uniref:EmrB/QacA subfamily drug resistance transporter n=1 Tax=Haloactinopolyspora alba TaxID=648780 RepID=A0A2P8E8R4_9ACTN|nr:DHA2 family efflux MFS transporter permease subunit [Haloactinopolyspora alba]PSL05872.1 EmrB/QacA subfamily drug resistance transporter [Haloactinopolyspora alba]
MSTPPVTAPGTGLSDRAYRRRWATLGVLSLSLVLIGMDTTVLNTALPTMQRDLSASASELQWIIDAYTLAFAGLLLTAGAWGDKYGRKVALVLGLIVFGGASVWGATADTAGSVIAARAVMGAGGALIMPSTLSILIDVFRDPAERKRAIGVWSAMAGIGIAGGPALGGWLLEHFWWGSALMINVPIVGVTLGLGLWLVPESRDRRSPRLDLVGAGLSVVGLVTLVWSLIEAPERGWTDAVPLGGMALAAVVLVAFVLWERRHPAPMLPIELFRNRRFSIPALSITLVFFAMMAAAFFLSVYLQTVLGYTPLEAGLRILPLAVGLIVGGPTAMAVAQRVGERWPTVLGLVLLAVSFWIYAGTTVDSAYAPRGLGATMLLGFGMAFAMGPATESVMGSVPRAKAGVGSAVNDAVRQVGGALGIAVLISVLNSVYSAEIDDSAVNLPGAAAHAAQDSIQGAYAVAQDLPEAPAGRLVAAADSAFVEAMTVTVVVAAVVVLAGALLALVAMPDRGKVPDADADADDGDAADGDEPGAIAAADGDAGRNGGPMR